MVQVFKLITTYLPFIFLLAVSGVGSWCMVNDSIIPMLATPLVMISVWIVNDWSSELGCFDRHLWTSVAVASIIILQSVTLEKDVSPIALAVGSFLSTLGIPVFLIAHLTGERNKVLIFINILLIWIRPESVINVIGFVISLIFMLIVQLSKISRVTLMYDKEAALSPILRTMHLLRIDRYWVGVGLIHVMIEYYRRHVPIEVPPDPVPVIQTCSHESHVEVETH